MKEVRVCLRSFLTSPPTTFWDNFAAAREPRYHLASAILKRLSDIDIFVKLTTIIVTVCSIHAHV